MLFSGPMVRALLEGRKTQTRRVVKPQPYIDAQGNFIVGCLNYGQHPDGRPFTNSFAARRCPYGKVGDRLWVRETWQVVRESVDYETGGEYDVFSWDDVYGPAKDYLNGDARFGTSARVFYAADGEDENPSVFYDLIGLKGEVLREREIRWRPSIHMPRWASRLALEIVDVRVESVASISRADAIAEGATSRSLWDDAPPAHHGWSMDWSPVDHPGPNGEPVTERDISLRSPEDAFANYLNALHGGPRWNFYYNGDSRYPQPIFDANPWVWVVEFKVVTP